MASGTIRRTLPKDEKALFKLVHYTCDHGLLPAALGGWTVGQTEEIPAKGDDSNVTAFNVSTPSGYTPICIKRFSTGSNNIGIARLNATATSTTTSSMVVCCVNAYSTSSSIEAVLDILYIKSEFVAK